MSHALLVGFSGQGKRVSARLGLTVLFLTAWGVHCAEEEKGKGWRTDKAN